MGCLGKHLDKSYAHCQYLLTQLRDAQDKLDHKRVEFNTFLADYYNLTNGQKRFASDIKEEHESKWEHVSDFCDALSFRRRRYDEDEDQWFIS